MTRHCVLDIETTGVDVETCECRVVGILDVETKKYYAFKWTGPEKTTELLSQYDWVITFNGKLFDLPVLERHGVSFEYKKHADVYQIFKKRGGLMNYGGYKSYSLKNLAKELLPDHEGKGDIDYKVFQKTVWTPEEQRDIARYLKRDLETTLALWDVLVKQFDALKEYLPDHEVAKYNHIRTSSGSYVYKVFCHLAGLAEEYNDKDEGETFPGAYVSTPSKEVARGAIYSFDFASLYPSMIVQMNLQSWNCDCCEDHERWRGGGHFTTLGSYCTKYQGKCEKIVKQLFAKRKEYKATKDPRQYAVKIILNTFYGASGNPVFKSIYHRESAADTAGVGKQCILKARAMFLERGYELLYSDTDSVYIQDIENRGVDNAKFVASIINEELRAMFPFPWTEFGLAFESEIKYIQFFKGDKDGLKKKHYLYVTNDDKLVVKGLPILKRDCSAVSQEVFKQIKPAIIERHNCKFPKKHVAAMIENLLHHDPMLLAKRFEVKDASVYKSASSLQAQISAHYGPGEHYLVKNHKLGAGKNVKYCTLEESRSLNSDDIDMHTVWSELGAFVE